MPALQPTYDFDPSLIDNHGWNLFQIVGETDNIDLAAMTPEQSHELVHLLLGAYREQRLAGPEFLVNGVHPLANVRGRVARQVHARATDVLLLGLVSRCSTSLGAAPTNFLISWLSRTPQRNILPLQPPCMQASLVLFMPHLGSTGTASVTLPSRTFHPSSGP